MSLDPVRAARVRRMVLNPSTWPQSDRLAMKRIQNDQLTEFGMIAAPVDPQKITICIDYPAEALQTYDGVEALIEAGWAVD